MTEQKEFACIALLASLGVTGLGRNAPSVSHNSERKSRGLARSAAPDACQRAMKCGISPVMVIVGRSEPSEVLTAV